MKNIRVALSGSGFRFPVHVGALMALRDQGYNPVEYAGTSGGSIIAALAAVGMTLETMKTLTMTNNWSSMLSMSLGSILTGKGYCDGSNLEEFLMSHTGGKTFKQVTTSLVIMSSDITNAKPFRWSKETTPEAPVALAARASASIPFIYTPVAHNNVYSVDGGVENNLPVMQLVQDDILRIGIDLVGKDTPLTEMGAFDIAGRMMNMMLGAAESTQALLGLHTGAKIAYVESGFASSLDRNMNVSVRQQLFDAGYNGTVVALQ